MLNNDFYPILKHGLVLFPCSITTVCGRPICCFHIQLRVLRKHKKISGQPVCMYAHHIQFTAGQSLLPSSVSLWSRSGFMELFKFCSLIVFLQLSGGFDSANGEELDVSSEGELVEKLLSNYHKHGRPVINVSICV